MRQTEISQIGLHTRRMIRVSIWSRVRHPANAVGIVFFVELPKCPTAIKKSVISVIADDVAGLRVSDFILGHVTDTLWLEEKAFTSRPCRL